MEAEVKAASVKWVGEGTWTPESICFDWDNDSYQVWVCTNTNGSSLANGDSVDLTCAESTEFVCPWTQYYWIGTFEIKLFTSYLHFLFIWILIQLSSHVCVCVSVMYYKSVFRCWMSSYENPPLMCILKLLYTVELQKDLEISTLKLE